MPGGKSPDHIKRWPSCQRKAGFSFFIIIKQRKSGAAIDVHRANVKKKRNTRSVAKMTKFEITEAVTSP